MKNTGKYFATTLAALSFAVVTTAFGHGGPGMGMGMGMGPGMGPMCGAQAASAAGGCVVGGDPVARHEARLAALKADLKITPTQEPAWQAFIGQAGKMPAMQGQRGKAQPAAGTAPEQMAQRSEQMKQRLAQMETMSAALKDLYAVLTPEQKALADQRMGQMGQMGQMGRHRMAHWGAGR